MEIQKIEELFCKYEDAFRRLDMEPIAEHYNEHFLSAGPKGVIAQNKNEFFSLSKQAAGLYRSLGQNDAQIISKKIIPISNEYTLVTVHWGVRYEKAGNKLIEFDVSYLVQEIEGKQQILLFITHQDEAEAMRDLGIELPDDPSASK